MTSKEFYRSYIADDSLSELSSELITVIKRYNPVHALDFGCGSGKHSAVLHALGVSTIAIDISMMNVVRAQTKYELPFVACGDETYLRNLVNIDVVFTCSVLDHIENIAGIIGEFKRIANKSVILAETQDVPGEFYYKHEYEKFGFKKVTERIEVTCKDSDGTEYATGGMFVWESNADGAKYHIWIWEKGQSENLNGRDDLA